MASTFYVAPTQNFLQKQLSGAINDTTQTITLSSTTNMQAPGYIVIDRTDSTGTSTPNAREVVSYTGISGNDLTGCVRGEDSSTARSHSDGAIIETSPTVGIWNSLTTIVASAVDASGYLRAINSPVSIAVAQLTRAAISSVASVSRLNIGSMQGDFDEWVDANETWTYASATSFTIAGVDRTSRYSSGTRIKLTNNSSTKYFIVTSSSFATNTTVNITGGSDYTLANAAITANYYSYAAAPNGFPGWFAFTVAVTGFSADPTGMVGRFSVTNKTCLVVVNMPSTGTSNTTIFTVTAPVTSANKLVTYYHSGNNGTDNGSYQNNVLAQIGPASSSIVLAPQGGSVGWTASGNKAASFQFVYETT